MNTSENDYYLLMKQEEQFDKIHSKYKWGNYISNNLEFSDEDNRIIDVNDLDRITNTNTNTNTNDYLNKLNLNMVNDNQIREIFNTIQFSKTDNYYIGINIFNKRNYSIGNNVDKQLLFSLFNPEYVSTLNNIKFNVDEIFYEKTIDDNYKIPFIGLNNIFHKDITLQKNDNNDIYYDTEIIDDSFEIIHEINLMQGYEIIDNEILFKYLIKDNEILSKKYYKLYDEIINKLNIILKKNIEYSLIIVKTNEEKYLIENHSLHGFLNEDKYDFLLNDDEVLFTEFNKDTKYYNTEITLLQIQNEYKIKDINSLNIKLNLQLGKYKVRSFINDLMKSVDIVEGFQNNKGGLSLILVFSILLLVYLVV